MLSNEVRYITFNACVLFYADLLIYRFCARAYFDFVSDSFTIDFFLF